MMKCPQCDAELRVTHTFTVHKGAQTRDYKCTGCGRLSSSVTFLVDDGAASPEGRRRMQGGRHLAEKIRKDELILKEDDDKTQPS